MYRLVRLSCSPPMPVEADEAGGGGAVLRLVDRVPPAEPVLDDDDDAVLAGEAAVGTLVPVVAHPPPIVAPEYCNKRDKTIIVFRSSKNKTYSVTDRRIYIQSQTRNSASSFRGKKYVYVKS